VPHSEQASGTFLEEAGPKILKDPDLEISLLPDSLLRRRANGCERPTVSVGDLDFPTAAFLVPVENSIIAMENPSIAAFSVLSYFMVGISTDL
jgi:hypothetical protein